MKRKNKYSLRRSQKIAERNGRIIIILLFVLFFLLLAFFLIPIKVENFFQYAGKFLEKITGFIVGVSGDLRLEIDDNATAVYQKLTSCGQYCAAKLKTNPDKWNIYFYANFTRISTGDILGIGNGTCTISIFTGSFLGLFPMNFHQFSGLWDFNSSFTSKGNHTFSVFCAAGSENISLSDNFTIFNTPPYVLQDAAGYIDFHGDEISDILLCNEDQLCMYNFSSNISEDDLNDVLTYGYNPSTLNTTLTNFTLSSIGILQVNVTHQNYTGIRQIELNVRDSGDNLLAGSGVTRSAILKVNVQAINDRPFFLNLQNKSFNETQPFLYIINASDEEGNYPLTFNVSFDSCVTAFWSTRNNSDCTLFTIINYSDRGIMINFTPSPNDVGNYSISFFAKDSNELLQPYNATGNMTVQFSVLNINDPPFFTSLCNEKNTTENSMFSCRINASDSDDAFLTISSNATWFLNATNASLFGGNASVSINFFPSDLQVGNWSINVSVSDYGEPRKSNSTLIFLSIANVNDSVNLFPLNNITAYKNANYQIFLNASDDDLFIPDKNYLDEQLSFSANVSWISFHIKNITGNTTVAMMNFTLTENLVGNHTVRITVADRFGFSSSSQVFTLFAYNNSAPVWSISPNFSLNENDGFILNLQNNVSDLDGDSLFFTHANLTLFPSFSLFGGVISFSADDSDAGFQRVTINASDGKFGISQEVLSFNITNLPDVPSILDLVSVNTTEDNRTFIFIDVIDDDMRIKQKNYYNESFKPVLDIHGPNESLTSLRINFTGENFMRYILDFTPRKGDVGNYTIQLNVSDNTGLNDSMAFSLAVFAVDHTPFFDFFDNQSAGVGIPFFLDVNASDVEDGGENGNLTFTLAFLSGNPGFFGINSSNGVIQFTANASQAGRYLLNVSVLDSTGMKNSILFWIFIYDAVQLIPLTPSPIFSAENYNLTANVRANHTVGDLLSLQWYIQDELRNSSSGNGSGGLTTLMYRLSFNDETTCGRDKNLTLNVSNPFFSNTSVWKLVVNHTDQQPTFIGPINNISAGNSASLDLLGYFIDADYGDFCYNASLLFSYTRFNSSLGEENAGVIEVDIADDILVFSSSSSAQEYFQLHARDGNISVSSNIFSVVLEPVTQPIPQPQPTAGSGAGGSGESPRPVPKPEFLKILTPGKISLVSPGLVQVPILLKNTAGIDLIDIQLFSALFKDGNEVMNANLTMSRNYFTVLKAGEERNISIDLVVNGTGRVSYELFINASVRSPRFADWAKVNIELIESNITEVEKILIFTEELIVENPECLELRELLSEARNLYDRGNVEGALKQTDLIIDSCKKALTQKNRFFFLEKKDFSLLFYIVVLSIAFLFSGALYHFLRKWLFQRNSGEINRKNIAGGVYEDKKV